MSELISSAEELGKRIREARKEQGLTQEELAGISGTGQRFISDIEKGKETAQLGKVLLVLAVLGIAIYSLNKWSK